MRSLDIELPCCDLDSCEVHPEKKEWSDLENICNHPGENLDQIIFRLPCCGNRKIDKWIRSFALTKWEQGIDIAFVITPTDDPVPHFSYYWAVGSSESSLANLISRTVRGNRIPISIRGAPNVALIPNVFDWLSSMTEDGRFWLDTNMKIKQAVSVDQLQNCEQLELSNTEPIEEEEVSAMDGIIAHIAKEPRPQNPQHILFPKVLLLIHQLRIIILSTNSTHPL